MSTPDYKEMPSGRPRGPVWMALALLAAFVGGCGKPNPYAECTNTADFHLSTAITECDKFAENGAHELCKMRATAAFNREVNQCIQDLHADDDDCHGVGMNDNDSDRDGIPNNMEAVQGTDMCDADDRGHYTD